jgi:ubiquinone/menaquinone biosynthesis C-methylase UbiE
MKNKLFGNEIERMPDFSFKMMKIFFVIYYLLRPARKYLQKFGIKPGFTVVDYGCGTGAFIREASSMVGEKGTLYAVDIHEMAIESAEKILRKYSLRNVKTVLTDGNRSSIPDESADLIFALDMFHMVKDTGSFLNELNRITKKEGTLLIEDGHQPRSSSKEKILKSGCWEIIGEEKRFLKCTPVKTFI